MASATPTKIEILHAYRHLLRASLRAVHFATPPRFVVRSQLRKAFRHEGIASFDPERIRRTIWFLKSAGEESGLESKILKNLVRVAWERERRKTAPWSVVLREKTKDVKKLSKLPDRIEGTQYEHYEKTIAMLNDTMGLCLR